MNYSVKATVFRSSKEATGDEKKNGVLRRKFFLGFTMCETGKKKYFKKIFLVLLEYIYIYI